MPCNPNKKWWCEACQKDESYSTYLRHRQGDLPQEIKASLASCTSKKAQEFMKESRNMARKAVQKGKSTAKTLASTLVSPFTTPLNSPTLAEASFFDDTNPTQNYNISNIPRSTLDQHLPSPTSRQSTQSPQLGLLTSNGWRDGRPLGLSADLDSVSESSGGGNMDSMDSDHPVPLFEDEQSEEDNVDEEVEEDLERQLSQIAQELTEQEIEWVRIFTLKTEDHLSDSTFEKLRHTFPKNNIGTWKALKARINWLAEFKPIPYNCCINSCCCYVGPLADQEECPHCKEPRLNSQGKPRKTFTYVPIIPRLVKYFKNPDKIKLMSYRSEYTHDASTMEDVFDGSNYQRLTKENVTIHGRPPLKHKFFDQPHDIALGFSTDGFAPFKKRKHTCWPLLIFNYNLPPDVRFHLHNVLCAGVIPGPHKPKDSDSYLWPMIDELLQLSLGVNAFDISDAALFLLRAYLILAFGDMPAVAMIMRMKGHNAIFPCRHCRIQGIQIPNGRTYYVPLDRSQTVKIQDTPNAIPKYDPANLPLRTHEEFMEDARHVQFAATEAEMERRAKSSGIKGVPLLSNLPSLFFPSSFPVDFMHLIFENLIKNLVLLWTGNFKDLDEGSGSYQIPPRVWDAIGAATQAAGSTIPYAYGARPQNVADSKFSCTADMWSFWTLYLGPILLHNRFQREAYYTHFVDLVRLITVCLQFKITAQEIDDLRTGFQAWVEKYEKLYYQYKPSRLTTCPVTVHALLHIADGIRENRPVWTYWAFPMERYCGLLGPAIKSRRFPYTNLDNYVVASAQVDQIKNTYNLFHKLSLRPRKTENIGFSVPGYNECVLQYPRVVNPTISSGLQAKIIAALATRYSQPVRVIRRYFSTTNCELWGKVKWLGEGDLMRASQVAKPSSAEDSRDATYVRYQVLVDKVAHKRKATPQLILKTFYGQLQHIFVVNLPLSLELGLEAPESLILAAVQTCNIVKSTPLDMHYYRDMGAIEVVDITTLQSLVGRVFDRDSWVIFDRSGKLARAQVMD